MRSSFLRIAAIAFIVMALDLAPGSAQFNPIQAAKAAHNQENPQQQSPSQPRAQLIEVSSSQPASPPSGLAAQASASSTDDCCTADAMAKIAASVGFVDIVGIKLGMNPTQAVAAVKAHNPALKIETLTARLQDPSGPVGNFAKVPYSINAHTLNTNTANGPVEWIAIEFTTPPNPPVIAKIVRYTGFAVGQPVAVSSLLDSLRKKYGQDNVDGGGYRAWVYDSSGKLLTRTLTSLESGGCVSGGVSSSVPGGASADHPSGETGVTISLDTTSVSQAGPERAAVCAPLVFAAASNVGSSFAPNAQQISLTVTLESGALIYSSTKGTHDWLQSKLDAKNKQQNGAAAGRSGPQL